MVRVKGAGPVLLSVMLVAMIIVIICDVFLFLSIPFPIFQVWPLDWYRTLIIPPPSSNLHLIPMELQLNREVPHIVVETQQLHRVRPRSKFAMPTKQASNSTFIFHIFPGAGSGVIMELIESLQELYPRQIAHIDEMLRLSFPPIREWSHWHRVKNSLIKVINTTPKPSVVFIESPVFLSINIPNIHYICVMYDPLERLQNHYNLDHWGDDISNYMHPNWPAKDPASFKKCVQSSGKDCSYALARHFYTLWFCGFDKFPKCIQKKEINHAAILAKRTVENFLLAGVMENLEEFIVGLEQLVPSVFGGLEELYWSDRFRLVHEKFVPKRNNSLEEWVKSRVNFTLKEDYAFYQFTKTKFRNQYRQIINQSATIQNRKRRR